LIHPVLSLRAWVEFLYLDLVSIGGFRAVQRAVRRTRTSSAPGSDATITAVVDAMNTASALYLKATPCLQRSAVVTRLLRRRGIAADLVIGCHIPPLRAHAWVEVAGEIVSEHLEGLEYFRVLDRW
jgi:hypothetical protein